MRDLVIKAREDESARFEIIKSYEPLIKKCIRMYVKNYNYHNDALQHGYMVLLDCIYNYNLEFEYPFGAYLKMSLIYAMKDFTKRIGNNLSLDEEVGEGGRTLIETLEGRPGSIEESIINREDINRLYMALKKLSPRHREIIEEFYFKNMKMIDICKGRRCHYMTVVKLKERAIKSLRNNMK